MGYKMQIAGLERELPLFPVSESLSIAAFIMFGDVELTEHCAAALLEKAPEFDVILTAEAKSIPLAYEMARLSGKSRYLLGRKAMKVYMKDVIKYELTSITTQHKQTLYLDGEDAAYMRGKRVLIVDDVISTGESLHALESLAQQAGGNIVGKMAVLAEGDAAKRDDLIFLEPLPLFTSDGKPIV